MTTKPETPNKPASELKASRHVGAHVVLYIAVMAAGAASTSAAVYQVSQWNLAGLALTIAMAIAGVIAAAFAMAPVYLAKPWGEATFNTKHLIFVLTLGMMVCDGAFQMNAIHTAAEIGGFEVPNGWKSAGILALFQLCTFLLRGALITATVEREEDIARLRADEARIEAKKSIALAEIAAHQEKLALRRAKYAADKAAPAEDDGYPPKVVVNNK